MRRILLVFAILFFSLNGLVMAQESPPEAGGTETVTPLPDYLREPIPNQGPSQETLETLNPQPAGSTVVPTSEDIAFVEDLKKQNKELGQSAIAQFQDPSAVQNAQRTNVEDVVQNVESGIDDIPAVKIFFIFATIALIVFAFPLWRRLNTKN